MDYLSMAVSEELKRKNPLGRCGLQSDELWSRWKPETGYEPTSRGGVTSTSSTVVSPIENSEQKQPAVLGYNNSCWEGPDRTTVRNEPNPSGSER